jgi:hypothetical protein
MRSAASVIICAIIVFNLIFLSASVRAQSISFSITLLVSAYSSYSLGSATTFYAQVKNTGSTTINAYELKGTFTVVDPHGTSIAGGVGYWALGGGPGSIGVIQNNSPGWTVPSTAVCGEYTLEVTVSSQHNLASPESATTSNAFQVTGCTVSPPPETKFLRIDNYAISPDGETLYVQLDWDFTVIPYQSITYLPFSNVKMTVTAQSGTQLQMFEPVVDDSTGQQISVAVTGFLIDTLGSIYSIVGLSFSTALDLANLAHNIQTAFQNVRATNRQAASFTQSMSGAGFFTEIIYIVQVTSTSPHSSWQLHLQASAVDMVAPGNPTLSQDDYVTLSTSGISWTSTQSSAFTIINIMDSIPAERIRADYMRTIW